MASLQQSEPRDGGPNKDSPYDESFYLEQVDGSLASARIVLPMLFAYYKPASVVDVGCGKGTWLRAALECGAKEVLGLDGDYVDRSSLLIPADRFLSCNLAESVPVERRFDLAISVEVAEHLPHYRAETFVADLARLSDVVLFSAAIPYQGGTDHVNEQWLEWWAIFFRRHGLVPYDVFRKRLWLNPKVDFWYSQNLLVFCTEKIGKRLFPPECLATGRALSFPHPLTLVANITRYRPRSKPAMDLEFQDYQAILEKYLAGQTTAPMLKMLSAPGLEGPEPLFPYARTQVCDVQAELQARAKEMEGLLADLSFARAELSARERDAADQRAAVERLSARALELQEEIGRTSSELAGVRAGLQAREAEVEQLGAELLRRERDAATQTARVQQLTAQSLELEQKVSRTSSELEDAVARAGRLAGEIDHLRAALAEGAATLHSRDEKISRLSNEIADLLVELGRRDAELGPLRREIARLGDEFEAQAAKARQMQALVAQRDDQVQALTAEIAQRDSELDRLKRECGAWSENVEKLKDGLAARAREVEEARARIALQAGQVEALTAELARRVTELDSLKRECDAQRDANDDLRGKLAIGRDELRQARRDIARQTSDIEALTAANEKLRSKLAAGREELRQARGEITRQASRGVVSNVEQQLARLSSESAARDSELRAVYKSLSWRITAPLRAVFGWMLRVFWFIYWRMVVYSPQAGSLWASWTCLRHLSRLRASGLFDAEFYRGHNLDVMRPWIDPLAHYVRFGASENRNPNPLFDTAYYVRHNPDVQRTRINPLLHYLVFGAAEGRKPHPLFDTRHYMLQNPDLAGANPLAHFLMRGAGQWRDPNPLFDTSYYLKRYNDVARSGVNPLLHYIEFGAGEGRDPNPLFDTQYYLSQLQGAIRPGVTPLEQYLDEGEKDRHNPHPLFDAAYYLDTNPDVAASGMNPLVHFLTCGADEGRTPHPLFDVGYYQRRYPDAARSGLSPLIHYLMCGAARGYNPHPLFDTRCYLEQNPQIAQNPLAHFVAEGARQGRRPHPLFDTAFYLRENPDVAASGMNPLVHYILKGAAEGRDPNPFFDTSYYLENNPDVAAAGINPLQHYIGAGTVEGRNPSPRFDTAMYLQRCPEAARHRINPLAHYLESPGQQPPPAEPQAHPELQPMRAKLRCDFAQAARPPLDSSYHHAPLVTVVIPCYNYGHFLEDAVLSSLLACSHPMEIVVVDDGSTDAASIGLVTELAGRYKFKLVRQENTGLHGARNTGIAHARGKYVQFLDADDLLSPRKIDIQVEELLRDASHDIAVCDYEMSDVSGFETHRMQPSTIAPYSLAHADFLLSWERGLSIPIHCALFRRELFETVKFRTVTFKGKEDWIFWVELSAHGAKFCIQPDYLVTYRIHGKNMCYSREGMGLDFLRAAMYISHSGLTKDCPNFVQASIEHFRSAYLGSIKHEAIVWARDHAVS